MNTGTKNSDILKLEYEALTGLSPYFDFAYEEELIPLFDYLNSLELLPSWIRERTFLGLVNKKFELNSLALAAFYKKAAGARYTFNFKEKEIIQRAFDINDAELFESVLKRKVDDERVLNELLTDFSPVSAHETLLCIRHESCDPKWLRSKGSWANVPAEINKSLFSAFLWASVEEEKMHAFFDPDHSQHDYESSYWRLLKRKNAHLFWRENALHVVRIDKSIIDKSNWYWDVKKIISTVIHNSFEELNNHWFLCVIIDSIEHNWKQLEWEIASDFMLIWEKFLEKPLNKAYFQWKKIQRETEAHIGSWMDAEKARFDLVNEGFTYRDTFVISDEQNKISQLVLIFQKNFRDETPLPCPACRSVKVQGNSYPSLGVKSWECCNGLCPDRSKYNRGKRYSFKGLMAQQSISEESNTIPRDSVRKWQKDVVKAICTEEILEMLIRHYSIVGDHIQCFNLDVKSLSLLDRKIRTSPLPNASNDIDVERLHFFNRYFSSVPNDRLATEELRNLWDDKSVLYHGESAKILRKINDDFFDWAVTSPPYYNAREYSQWPNIYCYLSDMKRVNEQVFRTLKPWAVYLYNIFDYFDNEKTVALSAMGQKRIPLSAYTVDLFRRIWFELLWNIVWFKWNIEGKRGFNGWNFSPFYQSPFNCWEHILLFQKPINGQGNVLSSSASSLIKKSQYVFECTPVIKMIRGENILWHSAPFPEDIPDLLSSILPKWSRILDPFNGSWTTWRSAEKHWIIPYWIELSKDYCELSLKLRR